jgi:hypothetical protein
MTLLTEKRDVQDQLINHLIGIGWRYLPPGDPAQHRAALTISEPVVVAHAD